MTTEEVIAEVRSIAEAMAISRAHPGEVSGSVKYRVKDFLYRCPFQQWFAKGRQYLTEPGHAIVDGNPATIPVIKHHGEDDAVIDGRAVEICKAIIDHLMLAKWDKLPACKDWTADRAEQALREAAARLPVLCDRLEEETSSSAKTGPVAEPSSTAKTKRKPRPSKNTSLVEFAMKNTNLPYGTIAARWNAMNPDEQTSGDAVRKAVGRAEKPDK